MQPLRVYLKIAALTLISAIGIPLQWAALKLGLTRVVRGLPVVFHRLVCAILGFRVIVQGEPPHGQPTLIVSNHVSWADITVVSSIMPVSFIAKAEVAGWPLFGLFAKLQRSVFVDRAKRSATADVNSAIAARLAAGEAMVLFGEGTTGDGVRVLPFRSALVGAARDSIAGQDGAPILLQPMSIAYVARNGLPLGRYERAAIAWYGDMDLAPHLMGVLRGAPFDVVVGFGAPIAFTAAVDRKAATRSAELEVRDACRAALRGLRVGKP
ncbi:lysophospholipid acyltransferase family protein [Chelatococcus reniformis]|uniref:1-acyl-sn-glycerol-3-phosphate acyltransferase n=1 Tax=Chelatococcus reniformis TaxID=1494448 RepID=A0A916XPR6_9HYPH|nr:lysophospholipid acyltransferase family protein [Chelatococcus reniformis]GGC93108.1 1-acyl-sn-glycerol-3-phosphate acyltransferase [Chelatococcus reniformis]